MTGPRSDRIAHALGAFITFAGIMHFVTPSLFDTIVPPWLPPNRLFWTLTSGVAELIVGPLLLVPRTRQRAAYGAIVLFIAVYPANLYMAWDWRDRSTAAQLVAYGRLPLQFVLIGLAWLVARRPARRDDPRSP